MSEDQLVSDLRASALRHGEALAVPPVPWPALRRRRRRARARKAGLLAATCAGLVAVLALGPGHLLPSRPTPGPARGLDGPVGRLLGDRGWVEGLLNQAKGDWSEQPTRVLFADDVGATRLALVEFRGVRGDTGGGLTWSWFAGPAGAPAARMRPSSSADVEWVRARATVIPPLPGDPGHATVVAIGRPGGRLSVWTHNDVDRSGRVVSAVVRGTELRPGLYTARLAVPFPQVDVRLNGLGKQDWRGPISDLAVEGLGGDTRPPQQVDATWWAAARAGARGGATTPPPGLAVQQTYNALGLRADVPGSRALWVQPDPPLTRSVLALKAPSGGWVLVACASQPPVTDANGGTSVGSTIEAVATRPAEPPGRLALVWPLLDRPGPNRAASPTGEYALLGPDSAVRAVVPTAGGPVEVPLQQGAATTRHQPTGPVTFLGPAGVVATSPLAPTWDWHGDGVLAHQF